MKKLCHKSFLLNISEILVYKFNIGDRLQDSGQ